ncbi:MAG: TetR/AcrR family transcriptional regulator [Eubacteriales bacterium]|nr:TetR/AcrR family transcriptional regulator [Eubacteriales bacterium]
MAIYFHKNKRTAFTRKCIAEAIIELMQKERFNDIRISAVTKRAGVSRKTFYNYFDSLYSALSNYLQEIIAEYISLINVDSIRGHILEEEHILFSLKFFDKYALFFKTLSQQNMHCLMLDAINQFMIEIFAHNGSLSVYQLYCYSGGLLNTFLCWEENDKSEPPEKIARIIYELYHN